MVKGLCLTIPMPIALVGVERVFRYKKQVCYGWVLYGILIWPLEMQTIVAEDKLTFGLMNSINAVLVTTGMYLFGGKN